jgi:hypothetical protein
MYYWRQVLAFLDYIRLETFLLHLSTLCLHGNWSGECQIVQKDNEQVGVAGGHPLSTLRLV